MIAEQDWTHRCNNHAVILYRMGAGGKFLVNCLGMSRHAVLQDHALAQLQLTDRLGTEDKYQLLMNRIVQTTDTWRDLDLGAGQLFFDIDYEQKIWLHHTNFSWPPVIEKLAHSDLSFFSAAHNYNKLDRVLRVWPESRIIFIVNDTGFLTAIRPSFFYRQLWTIWNNIRGPDWPAHPPYFKQSIDKLPARTLCELQENFSAEFSTILTWLKDAEAYQKEVTLEQHQRHKISLTNRCYEWNADWFLDENRAIPEIKLLYEWFGYDDFCESWTRNFYRAWFQKITTCGNRM